MLRCRAMKNNNVVFFNSVGKDETGRAVKAENYSSERQAVVDSLTQRLSVIKDELWYLPEYGIPLLDKLRSKLQADLVIGSMIERHPDVIAVQDFSSEIINHKYMCKAIIETSYGTVYIQI